MKNCPHARLRPRRATAVGAATLVFVGVSGAGVPAASAADIYNISIASSGLAVHIHDPNLVLQPDVKVGPYTALAALDNLGRSTAQAGAPFLGDYVGPLVGHFNGLGAGQIPPFPPVPGEVRSSYPGQPSAAQQNGGYSIEAKSAENESTAAVGLGPAAPGAENATLFSLAHALVDGEGVLNAVGSSGVDLFNVGGVLDIGRVSSTVTMIQSGSGPAKFVTRTDVGTITISGQKFGLDENGLTAAGSNSGSFAGQVNDATKALNEAGISIKYIPGSVKYRPGTKVVESVESGVVAVSYEHEVPSQGLVTNTYTLGHVELTATSQSFGTVAATQPSDATAGGATSGTADSSPTTGAVAAPGSASPTTALSAAATSLKRMPAVRARQLGSPADEESVAIITPLLRTLRFGSTLGLPDGCNIVTGSLGAGATELGVGNEAGPALSGGVENCTMFGNAGGEQLTAAMAGAAPLAVINPAIDPGIDAFADALETIGRDQAAAVAPFGPTMVGMAHSARFFKGCETC